MVTTTSVLCRELGKEFFLDADKLQVPFLIGSMTDDKFVSTGDCYLRQSSAGQPILIF